MKKIDVRQTVAAAFVTVLFLMALRVVLPRVPVLNRLSGLV